MLRVDFGGPWAWFREGVGNCPDGWKANLLGRVQYRVGVSEAKEVEQQACMQIIYWRWGWIALSLGCFCRCLGTERGMCVHGDDSVACIAWLGYLS